MAVWEPHPTYFGQAVESVLHQSWTDFELVVVEDPSSRQAGPILAQFRDPRIRHFANARRTSFASQFNRGLLEARGELVARFDADDLCAPERLRRQVDFLQAHPEVGVVGCQLAIMDDQGKHRGYRNYPTQHAAIVAAMRRFSPLPHPGVMLRKAAVLRAGGYRDTGFPGTEDYELWCRLAVQGVRFANLAEALVRYRIHPRAMKSARLRTLLRGTLAIKEEYWKDTMDFASRVRCGSNASSS